MRSCVTKASQLALWPCSFGSCLDQFMKKYKHSLSTSYHPILLFYCHPVCDLISVLLYFVFQRFMFYFSFCLHEQILCIRLKSYANLIKNINFIHVHAQLSFIKSCNRSNLHFEFSVRSKENQISCIAFKGSF